MYIWELFLSLLLVYTTRWRFPPGQRSERQPKTHNLENINYLRLAIKKVNDNDLQIACIKKKGSLVPTAKT